MKKFLLLLLVLVNLAAFSQKPNISINHYRFDTLYSNMQSVGDTTLYKPVVINSNGKVKKFTYWPSTGGGSMTYPGAGIALSTGSAWGTSITDNSTDWNTAYTDRLKWDGGATGLAAATGRTSLGGTTIGQAVFTLTNPSAITFPRYNADNTVTARSATELKTDLSLTPGTNIQAYDLDLDTWAGITPGGSVGTFLATPSSSNLISAVTDETGSGALVFGTTPTLATPVINGLPTGTGVASAATASTLVSRDANANITANNWLGGYATTATAAGTTTLTVGSSYLQYFTGTTTQTVTLPVVSTLTLGHQFVIVNNSTGAVTVNSSGGNEVVVLKAGTSAVVTTILTTGTSAASWASSYAPATTLAKGIAIVAPTSSENVLIWYTPVAVTITNVQEALAGTSPSVTYILGYASTRSGGLTNIVNSHAATSTTGTAATLTANVNVPAGSYIILTTSATSGTVTDFNTTINYRQ